MEYIEHDEQLGADIHWKDAEVVFSKTTHRGTLIEFVKRQKFGLSCFMNGSIQSCLSDEKTYHKQLTENTVRSGKIAIFGGGEGATAREILKNSVQHIETVDMFEWDADVVEIFRTQFPEWGAGIWNDSRLHIYNYDIFEHISKIPDNEYTSLVVDLFEPNDQPEDIWKLLFEHMYRIMKKGGTFSMYAGMYPHTGEVYIQHLFCVMLRHVGFFNVNFVLGENIPSYLGRPIFIYGSKTSIHDFIFESDRE
jgi:spermidine synthase